MATRQVQTSDVWELLALLEQKTTMIGSCVNLAIRGGLELNRFPINDISREIARMAEVHLVLKEALAALPKPVQIAEGSRRAS